MPAWFRANGYHVAGAGKLFHHTAGFNPPDQWNEYLPLIFDSDRALLFRDLTNLQLPLKTEWVRAWLELGRIPHWNPFHVSGFPFLADLNYGPLYPLNLLLIPFAESLARGIFWIPGEHKAFQKIATGTRTWDPFRRDGKATVEIL